jgi:prophage antirepressor-like protein
MNKENLLTKLYEGKEIKVIFNEDDEPLFEKYGVGVALGYGRTKIVKGKEYQEIQKSRIDNVMKNGSITGFPRGEETYLSEEMIYDFMFEAKTDGCKKFRKWLSQEVLPSLRKYGVYQSDEEISQDYLKYNYKALKETFTKCPIENISKEYDECMQWHKQEKTKIYWSSNSNKRKGSKHTVIESRMMIMSKIEKTLEDRNLELLEQKRYGLTDEINKTIKTIKDDIKKAKTSSIANEKGAKTKENNKLKTENKNLKDRYEPPFDRFICIEEYPLSKNKLTMAVEDWSTGKPRIISTEEYNRWKYFFKLKADRVGLKDIFGNIDFNKPVYIHYKVICHENNDTSNFIDALHDVLQEIFNCDDRDFLVGSQERLGHYTDRKDGKIWLYINN